MFEPEKAPRVDFNDVYGEYERPDGPYRRTEDYDALLALYVCTEQSRQDTLRLVERLTDVLRGLRED